MMPTCAWIAIGGAIGTLLRYQITLAVTAAPGEAMPWATILINITGSFLIGLFAAAMGPAGRWPAPVELRGFLIVGLCGGYTTFSAFSLQTLGLLQAGEPGRAIANVAISVLACLLAVWLGFAAATLLGSRG